MKIRTAFAGALVTALAVTAHAMAGSESVIGRTSDGQSCEIIIERATGTGGSQMSTQVTAGNGQVSASTTMPGGKTTSAGGGTQIRFGTEEPVQAQSTSSSSTSAGGTNMVAMAGGRACTATKND
ncbi:hypothetical protein [Terrihabitans rhizophilus]|uniref:Uncharacterized protein n=1 Tax=Terrihabitans rhizophilus TaxID=3092662 RepID=A0ABU4RU96_9HYPH|nr:hypothetical protein [Terrihabitans sp. PJ23]MDX6806416.1 hypothetical protein [Terrihabitans sp. PJ23]